jgi:hypothetical protein
LAERPPERLEDQMAKKTSPKILLPDTAVSKDNDKVPWTEAELTTEEDIQRNTHTVESSKQLRLHAAELASNRQK